jgi:hypothetical protein
VDSTEASDGGAIEQREPSNLPPASRDTSTGAVAGATAEVDDMGVVSGEAPPDAQSPAGPLRRRRRRRRRHPSSPGGPAAGGSVDGETGSLDGAATPDPQSGGEAPAEGEAPRPTLKLRNRRRRHRRPHGPGLLPGTAAPTDPTSGMPPATAEGEPAAGETAAATATALASGARSFSAPRRRRRHAPLAGAAAADAVPSGDEAGIGAAAPATGRPRRRRRPRAAMSGAPPGAPPGGSAEAAPSARQRRPRGPLPAGERGGEPRPDGARDGRGDDRRGRRRDSMQGGPGGRRDQRGAPGGRGRRDGPRPVERKLYSFDSVVDRGFDDVEEESGTRRMHWTIVKRTTADQVSRKALSARYVLQRDGGDSEFPSLGAARDAVNKKIVHPEKLTRSKAEYAAEKK